MPISRRSVVTMMLASGIHPSQALALSGEPFPVFESEAEKLPYKFRRRDVDYDTREPAGTLIVDPRHHFLYHVLGRGTATRYGVSVGKAGKEWSGEAVIERMAKWPVWVPTPEQLATFPVFAKYIDGMPAGPDNPMGARALYLYQNGIDTVYRIHGATKPSLIGKSATAGCIGLLNIDVIHLYDRVEIGSRVVVLPPNG